MRIQRKVLAILAVLIALPILAAHLQCAVWGLPAVPAFASYSLTGQPTGFPQWLCIAHYVNFLFIIVLIRSGLQILLDHPRLYWNIHCTPGTEWIRFTPIEVPRDRVWTAKDDSRYLTPWIGLPGGRHTLGLARHWHFASAIFWMANGFIFVALLFATDQWKRLVPTSWQIIPDAWAIFVHYATLHIPPEPNGYYQYNALQQLSYFGVVFILAPLTIITGPSMSPAFVNRFKWYTRLPGNRQIGRSIHFIIMCCFVAFLVAHVTMVVATGFARNMNHIVFGTDAQGTIGMYVGLFGVAILIAANVAANCASWLCPRVVQRIGSAIVNPIQLLFLSHHAPQTEYRKEDISPFLWPNGKMPTSEKWKSLAKSGFKDYRLRVYGEVDNPVTLSLEELRALGSKTQITLHHCIQGWSGIAAWTGVPMLELMKVVRPRSNARMVIFYSYGEGGEGGQYYDSHTMENMHHSQTMLAYDMNYAPLSELHGAPLRLRVENQLGFKMVKWIEAIEFVESVKPIFKGEGGYNEDNEFFNSMADI